MNLLRWIAALSVMVNAAVAAEHLSRSGYRLTYDPGFEADAKLIATAADRAIELLGVAFAEWEGRALIETANLEIVVHGTPTRQANEATATLQNGSFEGRYSATLHLFAPSKISSGARTTVGEPKDEQYHLQLLVHELSSIVIDRAMLGKRGGGWHIYSAPRWFVQGLEQYLALSLTGSTATFEKYLDRSRRDPRQVRTDFGVYVANDYVGGTALVAFVAREGLAPIKRLLMSNQKTFGDAMREELTWEVDEFGAQFQVWLRESAKPTESAGAKRAGSGTSGTRP